MSRSYAQVVFCNIRMIFVSIVSVKIDKEYLKNIKTNMVD